MQHPYNISPYVLKDFNFGAKTTAELMDRFPGDVTMIRNLALHTPNKYSRAHPEWTPENMEQGRQAITKAFGLLAANGSEKAAAAIQTICEQLQTDTFNGNKGPDYRDLIGQGQEALSMIGTLPAETGNNAPAPKALGL